MGDVLLFHVSGLLTGGQLTMANPSKNDFGESMLLSLICNEPHQCDFILSRVKGARNFSRAYLNIDLISADPSCAVYFEVEDLNGFTLTADDFRIIEALQGYPVTQVNGNGNQYTGVIFGQQMLIDPALGRDLVQNIHAVGKMIVCLAHRVPGSTFNQIVSGWIVEGRYTTCTYPHFFKCITDLAAIEDPPPASERTAPS